MAGSRSLARLASCCTGASPRTKPNPPTGIPQPRASRIICSPSLTMQGRGCRSRRTALRAAATSWQGCHTDR